MLQAYQQLLIEGYLEGRLGSGTYVAQQAPAQYSTEATRGATATPDRDEQPTPRISERGNRWLAESQATAPYFPDPQAGRAFRLGLPALDAFPHEIWGRLLGRRYRRRSPNCWRPSSRADISRYARL